MKLSYEDHNTVTVLTMSGELTADQSDAFRRACQERLNAGIRDVVLDMEYLTLIDSAGLELLLWLVDEVADRNGQVRLVNPDETVRKIFQLTRLDKRFNVHTSIESAAKSLR
ncbi:MAG: STAS domain-containing protein [Phycisphaerales bacterium]|nr:STAS domain-containing protein [Phycisphaerales bacterium]MCI0630724.1 STAS domain-containing protein [Phycisphaerales bacterium]MCI0676554.1 STAS domain-containing protein [Phycisphaerales bacterium]